MASTTAKKSCVKCPKGPGQVSCDGCERYFCVKHLLEHRQELNQQMDALALEHDQLQQSLTAKTTDPPFPFMARIDQWESRSIERIRQVASEVRSQLRESLAQAKKNIHDSLHQVTAELQENRRAETFTEIELNKWRNQLRVLKEELVRPSTIELINGEDEKSLNYISLLRLQVLERMTVPSQHTKQMRLSSDGRTVAGGYGQGDALNQLHSPCSLAIANDGTFLIADTNNDRIVRWDQNATQGEIVTRRALGSISNQLNKPIALLINRVDGCLITSEEGNRRVMRWFPDRSRRAFDKSEVFISNVCAYGLAMDDKGYFYVSDSEKHEVRRYRYPDGGEKLIVAGGNEKGAALHQLDCPRQIFVDADQSVYISDRNNHRVMKWTRGAREGLVVAGGRGQGNSLAQLSNPSGIFVDRLGSVYIVDQGNGRVVRWVKDAREGEVLVGGQAQATRDRQLSGPESIVLDHQENLYVLDRLNHRVQYFDLH